MKKMDFCCQSTFMYRMNIFRTIVCMALFCFFFVCTEAAAQSYSWGGMNRYAQANKELPSDISGKRVVFMGNSITEGWVNCHPDFFSENGYVGRGISGQTSYQFLLRFRQDVINLKPAVVVINAGTNDIAENAGPYNEEYTLGNIISMVELAQANHIRVILTSVLPAASFGWRPDIKDVSQKIEDLNSRIVQFARLHQIPYVDYYKEMVYGENKALNPAYTHDGVHPTAEGYVVMEEIIQKTLRTVLGGNGLR